MAVSFVLLVLLVTGPSHAVRPRTANSTARTSRIPNVYGPQDDRTAKMTLGPPTPAGGLVVRSSCSLVVLAPLFRALWPKLLDAAVTEAVAEFKSGREVQPLQSADLKAFF